MLSTLVIIATFYGYFYHESTLPGNLILELYALGSSTDGAFGDSTILQVLANFTEIQVHSAGLTNQTGWHTIMQPRDPYVSDLTSHLCRIGAVCVSWAARLAPGAYDYLKFNSSNILVNTRSNGNVSYALVGGGFEPRISGFASFIVQPDQIKGLQVDLIFSSSEVYARNGYLHAMSQEIIS